MFHLGLEELGVSKRTISHTFTIERRYYAVSDLEAFIKEKNIALTKIDLTEEYLNSINLVFAWGYPTDRVDMKVPMRVISIRDFVDHIKRINEIKLDKPIIIRDILKSKYPDILDGHHRVVKAVMTNVSSLPCYHLTINDILDFLRLYTPTTS